MSAADHSNEGRRLRRRGGGFLALALLALLAAALPAAAAVPTVTNVRLDYPYTAEYTSVAVVGEIDRQGEPTAYRFQYATQADFSDAVTGAEGSIAAGGPGPQRVAADLTGLQTHTTYHLRLIAENADGSAEGIAASTFETKESAAPIVSHTYVGGVGTGGATLNAEINPAGLPTEYHFQYVPEEAFQTEGWAAAQSTAETPLAGAAAPYLTASGRVEGLQPDTGYRFRAVAVNSKGATAGEERWLRTQAESSTAPDTCPNAAVRSEQHAGFLPNCRAYELVSPAEKGGGEVLAVGSRTHAAAEGNALEFSSLEGFGDVRGMSIATEYLARRASSDDPGGQGWATHSVTPPQGPFPTQVRLRGSGIEAKYQGLTPTLDTGAYVSWSPLTSDPYSEGQVNVYLRRGLRSGIGSDALITRCTFCEQTATALPDFFTTRQETQPEVAGLSEDGRDVIFESPLKLTPDALDETSSSVPSMNVYESDGEGIRLVSVLPDGEAVPGAAGLSVSGVGGHLYYTPDVISSDGSRAIFTANPIFSENPQHHAACEQLVACGDVYIRNFAAQPPISELVNHSERTDCADHDPCNGTPEPDPGGHKVAVYWDASRDGSRVYFTSNEELTDSPGSGLYLYDATRPAGQRLTLVARGTVDGIRVIGASADGSVVYFASSQDVAGQPSLPAGREGLYMWRESTDVTKLVAVPHISALANDQVSGQDIVYGERQSRVSADGRFLLFGSLTGEGILSVHGGVDADQGSCANGFNLPGCSQLYLYDSNSDVTRCVSCPPDGSPATAEASDTWFRNRGPAVPTSYLGHALSDEGRFVFFMTRMPLVEGDTNGVNDVYQYENETGSIRLLSTGTSSSNSYFMDASPDGSNAFIATAQQLLGWDQDQAADMYDVRAGGGFPEPPPVPASCVGEACRAPLASAPAGAGVASSTFAGPGNPRKKLREKHRRHRHHHRHHAGGIR